MHPQLECVPIQLSVDASLQKADYAVAEPLYHSFQFACVIDQVCSVKRWAQNCSMRNFTADATADAGVLDSRNGFLPQGVRIFRNT